MSDSQKPVPDAVVSQPEGTTTDSPFSDGWILTLKMAASTVSADPWKHVPAQYKKERWAFDFDEKLQTFFVHSGGYRICDAEDSEVATAICAAFNGTPVVSGQADCVKCGAPNDNPRYHRASVSAYYCSYGDNQPSSDEHLHRYCKCGWDWAERLPSPPSLPKAGETANVSRVSRTGDEYYCCTGPKHAWDCPNVRRGFISADRADSPPSAAPPLLPAQEACTHPVVCGNDDGGWFCGKCNAEIPQSEAGKIRGY